MTTGLSLALLGALAYVIYVLLKDAFRGPRE